MACFTCKKNGPAANVCKGKTISNLGEQDDFDVLKCDIGEKDC